MLVTNLENKWQDQEILLLLRYVFCTDILQYKLGILSETNMQMIWPAFRGWSLYLNFFINNFEVRSLEPNSHVYEVRKLIGSKHTTASLTLGATLEFTLAIPLRPGSVAMVIGLKRRNTRNIQSIVTSRDAGIMYRFCFGLT